VPLPKPRTNETEEDFLSRCMGDQVMNQEYPDQDIRAGVCYTQWNRKKSMNTKLTIPLEIKALGKREFEGYGSIFGNKDWGDDVVLPGAFTKTLAEHKSEGTLPMMFWMHDPSRVPGKWLDMHEDENGLHVKGQLADTPLGNEIHTLLGMKAVSGLSIGYITQQQDFNNDGVRLIKQADLLETSIVSIPMNPKAQIIHAKSRLSERGEYVPNDDELTLLKRDVEQFLRKKGFSKLAKVYVSNLFKDSSVTLDDPAVTVETEEKHQSNQPIAETVEEVEVNAGLQSFREKQEAYELNKLVERYFKNG
jgi:HK97 family phage prohead protease